MTPSQYHLVLERLDAVLKGFSEAEADIDPDDDDIRNQLWRIRTHILKAESGHPFPFAVPGVARPETPPPRASPKAITVLVADDHESVRAVLSSILEPEAAFELVGEAVNGREAVEMACRHLPDVIVMDLDMPVLDGLSATREILLLHPGIRILVFSANSSPAAIASAAEAGAKGYLIKPASRNEIIGAVQKVHRGRTVFPAEVGASVETQS